MSKKLKNLPLDHLIPIAKQFNPSGSIKTIQPLGNGNINDTFLVSPDRPGQPRFVLQCINTQVFPQPQLIVQNIRILSDHLGDRRQKENLDRRWEIPSLISTQEGQDYWCSEDNSFWRAISFLENSQSFDTIHNLQQAQETGYALGMFHYLISDLPPEKLADTLEGFHITPKYLKQYEKILATTKVPLSPERQYCLEFVNSRKSWASVLETAKTEGKLLLRLMHGDPKVNNVMFDISTGQAMSIVDLDTVKPGLIHYDLGDCLRSGCNPMGEETQHWEKVGFDLDLCQNILQGYLEVGKTFLTSNDYEYMFDAIRLIAFELGLRFFTDYLAGNVYFKVNYPEHNLFRALVQFQITESIESQEIQLRQLIQKLKLK
jgi:Ser/Thr protein kinase RdoA (MazF antagonist)